MIQTYADPEALSRAAADLFVAQARLAVTANGRFGVALSGGHTPRRTYELLAQSPWRDQVAWGQVHVFWGDERCVPPDDARSNYRMTREALLDHVPLPATQVYRIRGELAPAKAAAEYQTLLEKFFQGGPPRFDLVFLGLGDNGHTASLFPGTPVLEEKTRWAAEVYVAEQNLYRVTLTAPLLNQAAVVAFLVAGADKAKVLQEVRTGPFEPQRLPAQLIQPANGQLLWLVDRAAAAAA
jgi:6-phosphogluconolactonase